ncbi:MAG: cytochrome c [Actinobacteria bacterium]|nr:cytochrome c [Thermoleophilia bacterium]MCB9011953.1 cytochrome c [Actinomycetota bacterium]
MERLRKFAAVMAAVAVVGGVAAGCSDSDSGEASTPVDATTIANTAVQTDSEGNTAAATTDAATDTAAATDTEGGSGEASGDAAAGKSTFEGVCQGCHNNGGQEAGVGPKLAGAGLTADFIQTRINEGMGAMPAGLVSGDDLENVTAYVLSIQ